MNIVAELPFYSKSCGGVRKTVQLAEMFNPKMQLRFQRLKGEYPQVDTIWTVGMVDNTFPDCDICITYSDTPYIQELIKSTHVGRVVLNMLSYGMSIEHERRNAAARGIKVICSTKKIERAMQIEGLTVERSGFGMDVDGMFNEHWNRDNVLAIYYHNSPAKKYDLAVKISNALVDKGIISGVYTFGTEENYHSHAKPKKLIRHFSNASRKEVHDLFNLSKCFLMPSVTEGLNLTPVESTLCGCPAVICDGAIDELFFHNRNCIVTPKDDSVKMLKNCMDIFKGSDDISDEFEQHMKETIKPYTWGNYINRMHEILGV